MDVPHLPLSYLFTNGRPALSGSTNIEPPKWPTQTASQAAAAQSQAAKTQAVPLSKSQKRRHRQKKI